jgi:hypothetical protein
MASRLDARFDEFERRLDTHLAQFERRLTSGLGAMFLGGLVVAAILAKLP